MDRIEGFWAGARAHGRASDAAVLAAAAASWSGLAGEGARGWEDWLRGQGVEAGRARAWGHTPAGRTRGRALTLADPAYPAALRRTASPPPVLCVEGDLDALAGRGLAIVGTRACTAYGASVARHLATTAAVAGLVVVSGLARGIDGEAHRAALTAGRTVAVLGHGLDHTAPPAHRSLRAAIVGSGGAVVSAWEDAQRPTRWTFPARNRWIAGLSEGVVVVEAGARSGASITARLAGEEGRDVAAVPGRLGDPASAGCLALLAAGATPLVDVEAFVAGQTSHRARRWDDWLEALFAGVSLDEVARRHGRSAVDLLEALTRLELEGRVVRLPGPRFAPAAPAGG